MGILIERRHSNRVFGETCSLSDRQGETQVLDNTNNLLEKQKQEYLTTKNSRDSPVLENIRESTFSR